MPAALRVTRRSPADEEEIFQLYHEAFGEDLTAGSRVRWRWQYLENPATAAEGPVIWVARDGDELLGQYASMPVGLWWGKREVRASWGMDVFVRAQARGRGIGALLFTTWSEHVEVALGLGLTPSSYSLFRKLEYHDVGPVPFFQKVLDPKAVASRHLGPMLGALTGPTLGLGLRVIARERARPVSKGDVTVRSITGFDAEYDGLWRRARASYAMCVRRDASYLQWKYAACPHRLYELREARRGDELAGFAVSRHEDYRGIRLGWIVDVFADAADHETKDALLDAVLASFRDAGVARAQAFSMNAALSDDLRGRGFRPGKSKMLFCVRSRVNAPGVFEDLGGWHVVFGDSDMDR